MARGFTRMRGIFADGILALHLRSLVEGWPGGDALCLGVFVVRSVKQTSPQIHRGAKAILLAEQFQGEPACSLSLLAETAPQAGKCGDDLVAVFRTDACNE